MLDLQISDLGANGSGVAKQGGFVYFVPFSIDGEKVEAEIVKSEKRYAVAKVTKVIKKSVYRTKPVCPYFEKCGGCSLQHMTYQKQLAYKTDFIKNELFRAFGCEIAVDECFPSKNQLNYRNKINFNIKNNKLCFLDVNNQPIQINYCPLFCSEINKKIISIFNNYFSEIKNKFFALHIRKISEKYQFTLISSDFELKNQKKLVNSLKQLGIQFSLFVSKSVSQTSSNITDNIVCKYGEPAVSYNVGGASCQVSPGAFLQVNEDVQNEIYKQISDMVKLNSRIVNAYGGTGILAAALAKHVEKVFSIEINKAAAGDCKQLFENNNIENAVSICGDCKIEVPKLLKKEKIDAVILDPPRSGVEKSILDMIKKTDIQEIIYLSCNPQTLIRDLKVLQECFYIDSVKPYDMFPQTYHIETLVKLSRK